MSRLAFLSAAALAAAPLACRKAEEAPAPPAAEVRAPEPPQAWVMAHQTQCGNVWHKERLSFGAYLDKHGVVVFERRRPYYPPDKPRSRFVCRACSCPGAGDIFLLVRRQDAEALDGRDFRLLPQGPPPDSVISP